MHVLPLSFDPLGFGPRDFCKAAEEQFRGRPMFVRFLPVGFLVIPLYLLYPQVLASLASAKLAGGGRLDYVLKTAFAD